MPKVSIVMPVYNGERYIQEAIDSILSQTFTDWEFLIINEYGSNKAVTHILQKYAAADSRIQYIQNTERLGISASLNIGLDRARGMYIARMDADDISLPDRLAVQVAYMDAHPEIGICGLKPEVFGTEHWEWNAEHDARQVKAEALFFLPALHPTVMMRKSILDQHHLRYNPAYPCTEDYDLFARALSFCEITNLTDRRLFRYRRFPEVATYANQARSLEIYQDVMNTLLKQLGLSFSAEELQLLCIHTGLHHVTGDALLLQLTTLDLLLKQILQANFKTKRYDLEALTLALHKRWSHGYEIIRSQYGGDEKIEPKISACYRRSIFSQAHFFLPHAASEQPLVSVVMPVHNGQNYLYEALYSIMTQTFQQWELLVVNDGSTDDTALIVETFQSYDKRIRLLTNNVNLRISKTLNRGFSEARGIYIARMDDDDISLPERFQKQVDFLNAHPDISLVGTYQQHFGVSNWVHRPPADPEELRASLLFQCNVCHSTVMLRKQDFDRLALSYDPNRLSEDYDLWVRATQKGLRMATIPEILGEYRVNGDNITFGKNERFDSEARTIVAALLSENLSITIPEEDLILLAAWTNPFVDDATLLQKEYALLDQIEAANREKRYYDVSALGRVLEARRQWAAGDAPPEAPSPISESAPAPAPKPARVSLLRRILKRVLRPFYLPFKHRVIDQLENLHHLIWDVDGHLGDYHQNLQQQLQQQTETLTALQYSYAKLQNVTLECLSALRTLHEQSVPELEKRIETAVSLCQETGQDLSASIADSRQSVLATFDERIWKSEKALMQKLDDRIWKSEQSILGHLDDRVWKSEKSIQETLDARVWKAEQTLATNFDGRIWKAEQLLKGGIWNLQYEMQKTHTTETPSVIYDEMFYTENRYGSVLSAKQILPPVLRALQTQSIIDFGCGTGAWLWVAKACGVPVVQGLDGEYVPRNLLMISQEEFRPANLEEPVTLPRQYDLAISLEVAEHLQESAADTFVDSLCRAASIILFSAAHPGQGGEEHINEQPFSYWQQKFEKRSYRLLEIRPYFQKNSQIEWWYRENLSLWVHQSQAHLIDSFSL